MIIKNKDPLFSEKVVLIIRDYYNSNIIRLLPVSFWGNWVYQVGDDYGDLEENSPPFGKIIGWYRNRRSE